jgi:putative peptidoglycan binding protein
MAIFNWRALWRAIDRGMSVIVPPPAQARIARGMVVATLSIGAIGCVVVGMRVGGASPAAATTSAKAVTAGIHLAEATLPAKPPAAPTSTEVEAPKPEVAAAVPPAPPALKGALPVGKGMWLYQPSAVEHGDVNALVARAAAVGLTHVFVRTGSSKTGFYAAPYLSQLIPAAHAHGIRVYGWDFPYFDNVVDDVNRATQAITYTTADGQRIDGFSADIELPGMGVKVTPANAAAYGAGLRAAVGAAYPLIATVPRPSPKLKSYPYAEVVQSFDAIAPMVYWLNRDPVSDVVGAFANLRHFGKPILPIGQAYDGAADHGPPGVPNRAAIQAFMAAAEQVGVTSVSFWSWQHASQEAWDAIRDAPQFRLPVATDQSLTAGEVRAYQYLLNSLGFGVDASGVWDTATTDAVAAYQRAAHLPVTGVIDFGTRLLLLKPFLTPLLYH